MGGRSLTRLQYDFRGRRRNRPPLAALLLSLGACCLGAPSAGRAADGPPAVLEELGCAGCHRLTPPRSEERTLERYADRKGPDLFYAGSKFRPEWLRTWLARPTPIRPAGLHPAERTRTTPAGDALADAQPPAHPPVPAARVDAVVKALGSLAWGSDLLAKGPAARTPVPRPLAELNFVKFKGCGSCHRTAKTAPAVSGPDVHDAFDRLRPEFLASYIANPQAWDPVAPMPGYGLEPPEVGKLVEYLRLLSEDDDAKAH